jgi:hypothetical protein
VLLFSSLALLLSVARESKENAWIWSGLGFSASAILAAFLWVPVIYIAWVSSGLMRLWLLIGEGALSLGAMLPILDWITTPKRWFLPAAALLVALAFLVAGHFLAGKRSSPPPVHPIGHWLDRKSNEARWNAFIRGSPPLLNGPRLEVISDEWADGRRVLGICFDTSMHDRFSIIIGRE